MSNAAMLRHEPWPTPSSTEITTAGPVEGVHELRGDDADDAPVPAFAGDDEDRVRADVRVVLDGAARLGEDLLLLRLPAQVLLVELLGERARLGRHRLVGGQQQPRRDVGRRHPPGRVDARREDERRRCSCRSSCPARPGDVEQRPQADLVRPAREQVEADLRDHPVLADQRHDVGQRAERRDLDERRQPLLVPGPRAQRLHELERDADAGQVLVRVARSRGCFGIEDRQRRAAAPRSGSWWSVMMRSTPSSAARARGLEAADAAVHRDDERARPRPPGVRRPAPAGRSRRGSAPG